jgi:hypothetical protein
MAIKAKPDGYHAITPYLVVDGAARLIDCRRYSMPPRWSGLPRPATASAARRCGSTIQW